MTPRMIFEDSEFFVLEKPSGWITNSAKTTGIQPVVENWIAENFQFSIFNFRHYNLMEWIFSVAQGREVFKEFRLRKGESCFARLKLNRL